MTDSTSEVPSGDEIKTGSITVNVTEGGMSFDTEFSLVETVFWLESLKAEILRNVFSGERS